MDGLRPKESNAQQVSSWLAVAASIRRSSPIVLHEIEQKHRSAFQSDAAARHALDRRPPTPTSVGISV